VKSTSDEIERLLHDQSKWMVDGDVVALDGILEDTFTLTHITGYEQPKAEWLEHIQQDRMRYHRIEEREMRVEQHAGDFATALTRNVVTATIHGSHGTWNLESSHQLIWRAERWWIASTHVVTY
jgi:hypothetical protein